MKGKKDKMMGKKCLRRGQWSTEFRYSDKVPFRGLHFTSMAAEIKTNTRKTQYIIYFIRNGFTMSGGISLFKRET